MAGYEMQKDQIATRLARIEGQVRGIARMIDDDTYCIDVITQIGSVCGALQSVAVGLLDQHVRHCVMDAAASPNGDPETKLSEATRAIERLVRL